MLAAVEQRRILEPHHSSRSNRKARNLPRQSDRLASSSTCQSRSNAHRPRAILAASRRHARHIDELSFAAVARSVLALLSCAVADLREAAELSQLAKEHLFEIVGRADGETQRAAAS